MEKRSNSIKFRLSREMKIAGTAVLIIITVISIVVTASTFTRPLVTEKNSTACDYMQSCKLGYIVYLKNNSLYDREYLLPGEGTIFVRLTDHINTTISYTFECDHDMEVHGRFTLRKIYHTDLWQKEFTILSGANFSSIGYAASFRTSFPLNYTDFLNFVEKVRDETGVTARNPEMILECVVDIHAKGDDDIEIRERFTSLWNITIRGGVIQISKPLNHYAEGSILKREKVFHQEVAEDRRNTMIWSACSLALLIAFVVVTESDDEIGDTEIKKIKRRYKEYIVTVSEIPSSDESGKTVNVKSIDDLARMSDITGKPILHVPGSLQEGRKDVFCIIDGEVKYQYAPSENRHKPKKLELFYRKFY